MHNYSYPGEYLVVLEVISGEYSTCDKLKIKVIPSELNISKVNMGLNDNFIELYNPSKYETNLSWWRLRVDNKFFTLPKNTILLPQNYLKLSFDVTKLLPRENSVVQLLYPNGMLAFNFLRRIEPKQVNYKPKNKQEETLIIQKPMVYSVEKPAENNLNNQVATIINSSVIKNKSVGVQPPQSLRVVNEEENKKKGKFKFPINKWSFLLGGIILIAIVGMGYATKLDADNEKPF